MITPFAEAGEALQLLITDAAARLPHLVLALLVFVVFVFIARGVRAASQAFGQRHGHRSNLGLVLGRLAYGATLLLGLLTALVVAIPGFTPGQLVSVLGLSSVAIGFAFRDILQNFLAGILILLSEPFRIGDQIIVGEFEGTVEEIQTRATFIRTYDGRRVVIPNAKLFTDSVTVNTANQKRRLQYDIGIGNGDDIAQAKQIMLKTVQGVPEVLQEPPPEALVVALAESSVNIRLRWWVQPPRQLDVLTSQDAVLHAVKLALHEAGIDLPFPTMQILLHDQTDEFDGDRSRQREGWPPGPPSEAVPRSASIASALRELASQQASPEAAHYISSQGKGTGA